MCVGCVLCVAGVAVVFDLSICQLESRCYSLSSNSYMPKYVLVFDQVVSQQCLGGCLPKTDLSGEALSKIYNTQKQLFTVISLPVFT